MDSFDTQRGDSMEDMCEHGNFPESCSECSGKSARSESLEIPVEMSADEQAEREAEAAALLGELDLETGEVNPESDVESREGEPLGVGELAALYSHSYMGENFIKYEGYTMDDLERLITDPEGAGPEFGLDEEDIADLKDWMVSAQVEENDKQRRLEELRSRNPENPLLRESFGEVPEGYVSVYHYTGESSLDGLAQSGLRSGAEMARQREEAGEHLSVDSTRLAVDRVLDGVAPAGYSRTDAVYACDDYRNKSSSMGSGGLVMELKVDPNRVLVADAEMYTEARRRFERSGDADGYEEGYWRGSMTLAEYQALPEDQRRRKLSFPEVLIPESVGPEMMRVHSVQNVT